MGFYFRKEKYKIYISQIWRWTGKFSYQIIY